MNHNADAELSSCCGLSYRITRKGVAMNVKVTPKASKSQIAGVQNGSLKLKVTSPPEKGKANEECKRILAGIFDTSKNCICLVTGEKSQRKTFVIENIDELAFIECVQKIVKKSQRP
jgi:uncharacterized protein (TIGR00251 family)